MVSGSVSFIHDLTFNVFNQHVLLTVGTDTLSQSMKKEEESEKPWHFERLKQQKETLKSTKYYR